MKVIETIKQIGGRFKKIYTEIPRVFSVEKGQRLVAVSDIIITTVIDGEEVSFQGDEESQNRLARNFIVAKERNKSIEWKTLDNKRIILTAEQILDILDPAASKQTELWF